MCDKTLEDFLGKEHYNYYIERIKAKRRQRYDRYIEHQQKRISYKRKHYGNSAKTRKQKMRRKGTE